MDDLQEQWLPQTPMTAPGLQNCPIVPTVAASKSFWWQRWHR